MLNYLNDEKTLFSQLVCDLISARALLLLCTFARQRL